jgi:hypothetical protein
MTYNNAKQVAPQSEWRPTMQSDHQQHEEQLVARWATT